MFSLFRDESRPDNHCDHAYFDLYFLWVYSILFYVHFFVPLLIHNCSLFAQSRVAWVVYRCSPSYELYRSRLLAVHVHPSVWPQNRRRFCFFFQRIPRRFSEENSRIRFRISRELSTFFDSWNYLRKMNTGMINSYNSAILFGALEFVQNIIISQ